MTVNMECGPYSPVSIVEVPHLVETLAYATAWTRRGEVAQRKLQHTIQTRPALCLCYSGVIQISQLELTGYHDELPWLEVQQGHRAQRRPRQIMKKPDQAETHLRCGESLEVLGETSKNMNKSQISHYNRHYSQTGRHVFPLRWAETVKYAPQDDHSTQYWNGQPVS